MAESKINELEWRYLFSAFLNNELNKAVLSIMKGGLKGDITRQTAEIVKLRRKAFITQSYAFINFLLQRISTPAKTYLFFYLIKVLHLVHFFFI